MDELKFRIAIEDGEIIAAFACEYDRNAAMDAMREEFEDVEFTAVDDGE